MQLFWMNLGLFFLLLWIALFSISDSICIDDMVRYLHTHVWSITRWTKLVKKVAEEGDRVCLKRFEYIFIKDSHKKKINKKNVDYNWSKIFIYLNPS